jgi:thioredoxin reductase (NADPH)
VRYCPICDGYEAMDRRIGVIGTLADAGKKALFLRTYSSTVIVFETNDGNDAPVEMQQTLKEAGVKIAGQPVKVECTNGKVAVKVCCGRRIDIDILYPALGCTVRSELATALGAKCDETGNLLVDNHQQTSIEYLYAAGDVWKKNDFGGYADKYNRLRHYVEILQKGRP